MDTITHALSGALAARAAAPARAAQEALSPRARIAAGFAAAAFPDADFALRLADTLTYLNWHQGPTHSLVLLPLWAWLLAHLFARIGRRRHAWRAFYPPALLGIAAHIAGDLLTAYGTMLFAPLSERRYSLPIAFALDPYFTAILAAGFALALARPQSRAPALVALAVLGSYLGLQAALHQRALRVAAEYAATLGPDRAETYALAQPLTPFNWKLIVARGEDYHEAHVNLWRTRSLPAPGPGDGMLRRIAAGYQPVTAAHWRRHRRFGDEPSAAALARAAWNDDAFADFRRFAAFPVLHRVETAEGRVCVRFVDLRFTLPGLAPSFQFGLCRGAAEGWRLERVRGSFWID
ncbi:MAG TPA: metal-dependent hydrolase [Burkholderiales bacterium]|nr:metal-dependent hydrolase [Burkholderiales bacterium]